MAVAQKRLVAELDAAWREKRDTITQWVQNCMEYNKNDTKPFKFESEEQAKYAFERIRAYYPTYLSGERKMLDVHVEGDKLVVTATPKLMQLGAVGKVPTEELKDALSGAGPNKLTEGLKSSIYRSPVGLFHSYCKNATMNKEPALRMANDFLRELNTLERGHINEQIKRDIMAFARGIRDSKDNIDERQRKFAAAVLEQLKMLERV
jgi:hypothetical protein